MGVNSTRDTILHLGIELRKCIPIIDTRFLDISHCSLFNNVPHKEALDCLVLRYASPTIGAPDRVSVAPSMLITPTIAAFDCHSCFCVDEIT